MHLDSALLCYCVLTSRRGQKLILKKQNSVNAIENQPLIFETMEMFFMTLYISKYLVVVMEEANFKLILK